MASTTQSVKTVKSNKFKHKHQPSQGNDRAQPSGAANRSSPLPNNKQGASKQHTTSELTSKVKLTSTLPSPLVVQFYSILIIPYKYIIFILIYFVMHMFIFMIVIAYVGG